MKWNKYTFGLGTIFISVLVLFTNSVFLHPYKSSEVNTLKVDLIANNLIAPVGMAVPADGTNRLFILEQRGVIYISKNGKIQDEPFLDIRQKVTKLRSNFDERGLLGLAFHPNFKQNHRFFIYYSADTQNQKYIGKHVLSEFRVDPAHPDKAILKEHILLQINDPEWNHNGGQLAFGPDGYLYIGVGDGGGGGDRHGENGNGQNLQTLLGKILRIDVSKEFTYTIPKDNPFVGKTGILPEIYAYGLRNPWRFSFDRKTGELYCGDVGQDKYEETDIIVKGGNYGWRLKEGTHCFEPSKDCNRQGLIEPIDEYERSVGVSITGGYMYRGQKMAALQGTYLFADWNGRVMLLDKQGEKWKRKELSTSVPFYKNGFHINSFGEDEEGEIYILGQMGNGPFNTDGRVYKVMGTE